MAITKEDILVGPELAAEWLDEDVNKHNRKKKAGAAAKYTQDMIAGEWIDELGEPICFEEPDFHGRQFLLNGQNRLRAIIDSKTIHVFTIIRGLPRKAQDVMDAGAARSIGDTLTLGGQKYGPRLAAAARQIYFIENIEMWKSSLPASNRWIVDRVNSDFPLHQAVEAVSGMWLDVRIQPAVAAVAWYFGAKLEPDLTKISFKKLRYGSNMDQGDPILAVRNRLNLEGGLTRNQQLFFVGRGLNNARRGNEATRVQLPRGSKVGAAEIVREYETLMNPRVRAGYKPDEVGASFDEAPESPKVTW